MGCAVSVGLRLSTCKRRFPRVACTLTPARGVLYLSRDTCCQESGRGGIADGREDFRCDRRGRRACGRGSGRSGGAHGRVGGARHAQVRDDRRNVLQSGHRRPGQGPSGAGDRCARRSDGPRGRRRRHSIPAAQPVQGAGRPGSARASRSGSSIARRCSRPSAPRRGSPCWKVRSRISLSTAARSAGSSRRMARRIRAGSVVLTTGTFLNGLIHLGDQTHPAGRVGDAPALKLSERLYGLGLAMGRLKTGTPARLDRRSIDWDLARAAGGRRRPGAVLVPDRADHEPASNLRCDDDDGGDARDHSRQSRAVADVFRPDRVERAALLPVHRGQGRPVCGSCRSPGVSRAGRIGRRHGLSERRLDVFACGCARGFSQDITWT